MFCRMLCSDAQCCYNSSCGNRLFPWDVVCCVVMHSVVITAPVVTLFPWDVVCCVVMHSVVLAALVVTDCSHVLSYVV